MCPDGLLDHVRTRMEKSEQRGATAKSECADCANNRIAGEWSKVLDALRALSPSTSVVDELELICQVMCSMRLAKKTALKSLFAQRYDVNARR